MHEAFAAQVLSTIKVLADREFFKKGKDFLLHVVVRH